MKKIFCLMFFFLLNYNLQLSANELNTEGQAPVEGQAPADGQVPADSNTTGNAQEEYEEVPLDDNGNIIEQEAPKQKATKTIQQLNSQSTRTPSVSIKKAYHSEKIVVKKGEKIKAMYGGTIISLNEDVGKSVGLSTVMRVELFNKDELVISGVDSSKADLQVGQKIQSGEYIGVAETDTIEIRLLSTAK